jgi:Protein of unknown function (DUF3443)
MATWLRALRGGMGLTLCLAAISCGGGGGGSSLAPAPPSAPTPTSNVATVVVDAGPSLDNTTASAGSSPSVNTLFTSVKVCVPGSTTNCQTIDHIQVDTASFGLRILAPVLTLTLPVQAAPGGGKLVECAVFGDGYSWGPVALADFTIAGESVSSMPIHIIGDSRFPTVPTDCSTQGPTEEDTVPAFGANGILGIGVIATDCPACSTSATFNLYFACSNSSTCISTVVPLTSQVPNPVARFATDNNGSMIQLPSVTDAGAATITGSLIFGVDTQSNNQSGTQTVVFVDPNDAQLTMIYKGQTLTDSFIDSGTNGIYFTDSTLPPCPDSKTFYCPTTTQTLNLLIELKSSGNVAKTFDVVNGDTLPNGIAAFPGLAGTNILPGSFDWGLSFFYGRRVTTVLSGATTSAGTGPYIAF